PRRDCFVLVLPSSLLLFFFYSALAHRDLHSFPTRRSSDLNAAKLYAAPVCPCSAAFRCHFAASASSRVTLRPDSYRTPRLYCASANPCSAADRYHLRASPRFCWNPSPLAYRSPRAFCAAAFPVAARAWIV